VSLYYRQVNTFLRLKYEFPRFRKDNPATKIITNDLQLKEGNGQEILDYFANLSNFVRLIITNNAANFVIVVATVCQLNVASCIARAYNNYSLYRTCKLEK
jgi:hypothetical protein